MKVRACLMRGRGVRHGIASLCQALRSRTGCSERRQGPALRSPVLE